MTLPTVTVTRAQKDLVDKILSDIITALGGNPFELMAATMFKALADQVLVTQVE